MSSRQQEREQRIGAVLLVVFAAMTLAMVIWEMILVTSPAEQRTLEVYFLERSSLSYAVSFFLWYLIAGGVGLVGVLALIRRYGGGHGLVAEATRLSALAYFAVSYWMWSATWIVQYKTTLLADTPSNPPESLLEIFAAFDALWSLTGWGGLGPGIMTFGGLAWLLARGARRLPRAAAVLCGLLAASQLLGLVFVGVRGFGATNVEGAGFDFAFLNDTFFAFGRVAAALFAAAALYTEKGIFVRTTRH